MRGFSKTYAMSFHPETFTGYYEIIPDNPVESSEHRIDTVKSVLFMETERFYNIGIRDKVEIGFSGYIFATELLFARARCRVVFNLYDKGNDNLFENISVSPFVGNFINSMLSYDIASQGITYFTNYCGISVGTRKLAQVKYSFELFVSPSYLLTWYGVYNEFGYSSIGRIAFLTQSIDVPLGFRYIFEKRTVKFSIKSGIGLHFIVRERTTGTYATMNTSYSFNSSYISAFAEMGFHFGARRYNVERRKQRE
jgi:hypothetical protein